MKKKLSVLLVGIGIAGASLFSFGVSDTVAQTGEGNCYWSNMYCCDTGGGTWCVAGCDPCGSEED